MSALALQIAEALKQRLSVIQEANGYYNSLTLEQIFIGRSSFDPDDEGNLLPLVSVLLPNVSRERQVVGAQIYHCEGEFEVIGIAPSPQDDMATTPLHLQADIEFAVVTPVITGDPLLPLISSIELTSSSATGSDSSGLSEGDVSVKFTVHWDENFSKR